MQELASPHLAPRSLPVRLAGRPPTRALLLILGLLALPATGLAQDSAAAGPALAPLEELIGEWMLDPDSELIRTAPAERREALLETVGLAFEWGPNRGVVIIREIYPVGAPEEATGYGIAVWNPVDQRHHFMAANTEAGYFFDGHLEILASGAVRRLYEVSYPDDRSHIPGDSEPGWTRRFRDTYTVDGDVMEQRVEIFWQGAWRPFGGGDGVYRLLRRD